MKVRFPVSDEKEPATDSLGKDFPGTANRMCKRPEVEMSWQEQTWRESGMQAFGGRWAARSWRALNESDRFGLNSKYSRKPTVEF